MDLFREFVRRLFLEVSPIWKWAQRNWRIVLICSIASLLLIKYWRKHWRKRKAL
jgi:hypothetical protein